MCEVMRVSRSGYYRYVKAQPSKRQQQQAREVMEVKALAAESRYSYGRRRMAKCLQAKGYAIGDYAARTLMRKAGVVCQQRRRHRVTTQSGHGLAVAENLLNRAFNLKAPNRAWVADITYLWTQEGWLYIAAVVDLFSRRVVGWAMAEHMRETLVTDALQMALGRRRPQAGLLHHSDQGAQYASASYQALLREAGITVSMSRKGNCWDNAVMERFWGSLKSECTDKQRYATRHAAKVDVIHYIEMFYNSKRLHSTLGYLSPVAFEKRFLLKNMSTFT